MAFVLVNISSRITIIKSPSLLSKGLYNKFDIMLFDYANKTNKKIPNRDFYRLKKYL